LSSPLLAFACVQNVLDLKGGCRVGIEALMGLPFILVSTLSLATKSDWKKLHFLIEVIGNSYE
jgi:hypothetical protein